MGNEKYVTAILLLLFGLAGSCNDRPENTVHRGEDRSGNQMIEIEWDSTSLDIFYTSGQGNFFMTDSVITFADYTYAKVYNYNCKTGKLISSHFGLGNGPDDLLRFFYATPVRNDTSVFIINNNMDVSLYDSHHRLDRKGVIDFGWNDRYSGKYDSPEIYNFMLMTDFGANVYKYGENVIIPLQPVIRYACKDGRITKRHFKKSHVLGLLNPNTMKVTEVFGHYPPLYLKKSLPQFNFFSYILDKDLLYVNFPVDPLIYVYEYPDRLLYSFGFECKDIVRKYTTSGVVKDDNYDDYQHSGMNTEILTFPDLGLFFRTYVKNMENASYGMQIYNNAHDLLADIDVPNHFKLLGSYDSCFYGVNWVPVETDDNTYITFYKIKISL
jgi:hypothetical protein